MALSKALVQPFRKSELMLGSGWRGFFAPFNIAYNFNQSSSQFGPTILDLQNLGPFNTNNMPAGWFDLGWIGGFKITPGSKIGQIQSGYRGAVRQQVRGEVAEQFEFQFKEFTRLAWKIATGTQIFNLLQTPTSQTQGPLSGSGATTYALGASGYVASGAVANYGGQPTLYVTSGLGASFNVNDRIVCDADFVTSAYPYGGFAGSNGIPIYPNNAPSDVDFIRKTSDFVSRVIAVVTGVGSPVQDALILDEVFVGGGSSSTLLIGPTSPPAGSKIQKIVGIAAREGGTYITEWSALFILDAQDGDQLAQYYPHVSISQFKDVSTWSINNIGTTDTTGYQLDCMMQSLAFDDPEDGETVVGYRAFYPNPNASIAW